MIDYIKNLFRDNQKEDINKEYQNLLKRILVYGSSIQEGFSIIKSVNVEQSKDRIALEINLEDNS